MIFASEYTSLTASEAIGCVMTIMRTADCPDTKTDGNNEGISCEKQPGRLGCAVDATMLCTLLKNSVFKFANRTLCKTKILQPFYPPPPPRNYAI